MSTIWALQKNWDMTILRQQILASSYLHFYNRHFSQKFSNICLPVQVWILRDYTVPLYATMLNRCDCSCWYQCLTDLRMCRMQRSDHQTTYAPRSFDSVSAFPFCLNKSLKSSLAFRRLPNFWPDNFCLPFVLQSVWGIPTSKNIRTICNNQQIMSLIFARLTVTVAISPSGTFATIIPIRKTTAFSQW